MPRLLPIYSDYFHSPLTEDVEELLALFQQTDSVRYEVFSAIWREMGVSRVFMGISNMSVMKRFCKVTLATAMKYFLLPHSYQIRVGGLYLMYGFYHTQLAIPPVKIRLALKHWDQVQKFLNDSVDNGHQDVVYIYQKLVATKAFQYTAMPHVLTFQKQRKPKREPVCAGFLGRTTAVQELVSADILEEVANIQSQYEKLKEGVEEVSCRVTMTHRDFSTHLKDLMSEFIAWQERNFSQDNKDKNSGDEEKPAKGESSSSSSSRARLLSSIKYKSYSRYQEASKARRHRQAEVVDSSSSGAEHVQETGAGQKKRPASLRARTWQSLGVTDEKRQHQAWLLSAPEHHSRFPVKRIHQ